jgi:hypothetical protein
MPTKQNNDRTTQIEHATFIKNYRETDARGYIEAALSQLHSMVADIEREAQRPDNSLAQVLYHIRHEMAWKYANISSTLDNADSAVREALVAKTKIELLEAATPEA